MNINDLYEVLENKRELTISCAADKDWYALRAGIYRARKKFLDAFALIDETDDEDGFSLLARRDKDAGTATLKLITKEAKREWVIVAEPTPELKLVANSVS